MKDKKVISDFVVMLIQQKFGFGKIKTLTFIEKEVFTISELGRRMGYKSYKVIHENVHALLKLNYVKLIHKKEEKHAPMYVHITKDGKAILNFLKECKII